MCFHIKAEGSILPAFFEEEIQAPKKHTTSDAAMATASPPVTSAPGRKDIRTAYLLWLLLPTTGAHLAYLDRDVHALLHLTLLGGWGLGWLRDGLCMRRYVDTANGSPALVAVWRARRAYSSVPSFSFIRTATMLIAGGICASTLSSLPPPAASFEDATPAQLVALVALDGSLAALGAALGVYVAGALPPLRARFSIVFIASAVTALITHGLRRHRLDQSEWEEIESDGGFQGTSWCVLAALLAFRWTASYKFPEAANAAAPPPPPRRRFLGRLLRLWLGAGLVWCTMGAAALQRGKIDVGGDVVNLRDAAYNTWRSPVWVQMRTNAHTRLFVDLPEKGWSAFWQELREQADFTGKRHACRVLGVQVGADFADVKKAYKAAALELHPDKQPADASEDDKQKAQERFQEVQSAYETLQGLHKRQKEREVDEL